MSRSQASVASVTAVLFAAAMLFAPGFPGVSAAFAQDKPLLKIRINRLPIADFVPADVALSRGWFRDEGLDVVVAMVGPGALAMQAIVAGKLDVMYSGYDTSLKARAQGFDVVIFSNHAYVAIKPPGGSAILTRKEAGIRNAKDLEGKRVLMISLQNIDWAYTRELVARAGGDPAKVRFLELAYPLHVNALVGNQADAAFTVEPFTTIGLDTGKLNLLSYQYVELQPGLNITGWTTSTSWAKEHPQALAGFRRALQKAMDLLQANPQEKRDALLKFASLKPEMVDRITTNLWTTRMDPDDLQKQLDLYNRHGMLDKTFDVRTMIVR